MSLKKSLTGPTLLEMSGYRCRSLLSIMRRIAFDPLLALGLKIQRLVEWISWAPSARQLAWMLLAITPVGSGIPGVGLDTRSCT